MIVDWAVYRDGRRMEAPGDFTDALSTARAAGAFVWTGVYEATPSEFGSIARQFGLHPLAVDDALKAHQRPKLEMYDNSLFLVLKPIAYDTETDAVSSDEIMVFLGDAFIITVRHGNDETLADVRKRLERNPELLAKGPGAVLYGIVDAVVDHYQEVETELLIDLEELESAVFSSEGDASQDTAARIYTFKRQITEFQRAAHPLAQPLDELTGGGPADADHPGLEAAARPFFKNVSDHLARANESVDALDRLVSDILAAHLAQTSVRQNDDMRKISAWAAMAAVPTLIAGFYGMNFTHMPELHWEASYPGVVALMATLVTLLYRAFKRRGWL